VLAVAEALMMNPALLILDEARYVFYLINAD